MLHLFRQTGVDFAATNARLVFTARRPSGELPLRSHDRQFAYVAEEGLSATSNVLDRRKMHNDT